MAEANFSQEVAGFPSQAGEGCASAAVGFFSREVGLARRRREATSRRKERPPGGTAAQGSEAALRERVVLHNALEVSSDLFAYPLRACSCCSS